LSETLIIIKTTSKKIYIFKRYALFFDIISQNTPNGKAAGGKKPPASNSQRLFIANG